MRIVQLLLVILAGSIGVALQVIGSMSGEAVTFLIGTGLAVLAFAVLLGMGVRR